MSGPSLQPDTMGHWWVSHGPEDDEPTCRGCGQSMTEGSRSFPPCPRLEPCPRPYSPPSSEFLDSHIIVVPVGFGDDVAITPDRPAHTSRGPLGNRRF